MATISQLEHEITSLENRLKLLTKDRSIGEEEMTRQKSLLHHKIMCRRTRIDLKNGNNVTGVLAQSGGIINSIND